jgi:Uma2 family endonuclease
MEAPRGESREKRLTQEEFFSWLQDREPSDCTHYELIHGRIVMTPAADFFHASIGSLLNRKLGDYLDRRGLGRVLDSSAGYDLPSGDTLEPDVSFVSRRRLDTGPRPERGRHARLVPDLVVEVLSPSTRRRDRTVKKDVYAANGVVEYWLVDPEARTVTVFHRRGDGFDAGVTRAPGEEVASELFADLTLAVADVFAD